jgi:predicted DNA-binding protein (UPF0278 family)
MLQNEIAMNANEATGLSSISKASSYEEMGEFWDSHSTADYWDEGYDVEMEVRIPSRHRVNIEAEMFERIGEEARHRGVSSETLINLWIAERLQALATRPRQQIQQEAALR